MAQMNFIFICQTVDQEDPILATAVKWIESFARHSLVKKVVVLSLQAGSYSLPENVTVYPIQGNNRLVTLVRFYRIILKTLFRGKIDFFWINQGGPYPFLLLPFRLLLRKPVYHWKAHPYISPQMRFYAKYCDSRIFTCTSHSFPMQLPKIHVVGHGIDVEKFCKLPARKTGDIVTVGRIAPSKGLDTMVKVLDLCSRHYGTVYRLDIYGPDSDKERSYKKHLETLIEKLNLSNQVTLKGAVKQGELPAILNTYRVFINFSDTALDKAVVEAMACELPVLSTNLCVADILPEELQSLLFIPKENLPQIAKLLHHLLSQSQSELDEIGKTLRNIAKQDHSIKRLIEKVVSEIQDSL